MEGRASGSPSRSIPVSQLCSEDYLGEKDSGAGHLHRAIFPDRMTEQFALTQRVLRTKRGQKVKETPENRQRQKKTRQFSKRRKC